MDIVWEQIILDIIASEMEIDKSRNIWIRDQNRKIPNDDQLYLIVGMQDGKPFSSTSRMIQRLKDDNSGNFEQVEIQETQINEIIQIDILSRSNEALKRRWEIITALKSIYSQQKMEEYNFKIHRIPQSFINASIAEGGSQLNRYSLSFSAHVWYRKERILTADGNDYYDNFETRVDDANSIGEDEGIIEFTIEAED